MKKKILICLVGMITIITLLYQYLLDIKGWEGYYLWSEKGYHILVGENGDLTTMDAVPGDFIFDNYDTGDRIKIVAPSIMESYPQQAIVYFSKKLEDGNEGNIPENAWIDLKEMGYIN